MHKHLFWILTVLLLSASGLQLTGCGSSAKGSKDGAPKKIPNNILKTPDASPKIEPISKYGNPKTYKALNKRYKVMATSRNYKARGHASWYGTGFHGRRTSSGEPYDMFAMTAAHPTLPLPTYARVTNLDNGKSIVVKINDRGPFHDNRLVDLSYTAAAKLGILGKGTGYVELESIDPRDHKEEKYRKKTKTYLQVGVFTDKDHAEAFLDQLKRKAKLSAKILHSKEKRQNQYKVRIPVTNEAHEAEIKQKLAQAALPTPVTIIE